MADTIAQAARDSLETALTNSFPGVIETSAFTAFQHNIIPLLEPNNITMT
ncbi:MAG: hypothetical protein AAF267_09455 [Deinococcota bacterium]